MCVRASAYLVEVGCWTALRQTFSQDQSNLLQKWLSNYLLFLWKVKECELQKVLWPCVSGYHPKQKISTCVEEIHTCTPLNADIHHYLIKTQLSSSHRHKNTHPHANNWPHALFTPAHTNTQCILYIVCVCTKIQYIPKHTPSLTTVLHSIIDHCIRQDVVLNGTGFCWGSSSKAPNGLYDIHTFAHMHVRAHGEMTAATPTVSLCFLRDCLALCQPCDNVPFYFMHKSCAI